MAATTSAARMVALVCGSKPWRIGRPRVGATTARRVSTPAGMGRESEACAPTEQAAHSPRERFATGQDAAQSGCRDACRHVSRLVRVPRYPCSCRREREATFGLQLGRCQDGESQVFSPLSGFTLGYPLRLPRLGDLESAKILYSRMSPLKRHSTEAIHVERPVRSETNSAHCASGADPSRGTHTHKHAHTL